MLIQRVGIIQSFKAVKSSEQNKNDIKTKIAELKDKQERLKQELEKKTQVAQNAQIQYLIAKGKRDKVNDEVKETEKNISANKEQLSILENKLRNISDENPNEEKYDTIKEIQARINELNLSEDDDLSRIQLMIKGYLEEYES